MKFLGIALVVTFAIALVGCGSGTTASAERFADQFSDDGADAFFLSSLDEAASEANVVVRGHLVDVEAIEVPLMDNGEPFPGSDLGFVRLIIEVDAVLGGSLGASEAKSAVIRIIELPRGGVAAGDIRDSIPEGGIDGIFFLCYGPTALGSAEAPSTYFHLSSRTAALRSSNGLPILATSDSPALLFNGGGGSFEDAVTRVITAVKKHEDAGAPAGVQGICRPGA